MSFQTYVNRLAGIGANGEPLPEEATPEEVRATFNDGAQSATPDAKPESPRPLEEQISGRRFNPDLCPPPVRPIYTINGSVVCTPGNITTIVAPAKAGKTALLGAMFASVLKSEGDDCDTFGITSHNPAGRAVLHIDTEQSTDDYWHVVNKAMRRARVSELPPWFHSYCFTGWDSLKTRSATWLSLKLAAEVSGGVHSVLIDGYADLVIDVNDSAECNAFVAQLHEAAIQFDCPIIGILHFNPGSEKSRGHLGSQLERKSESNLRLENDGTFTELWADKQRRAPILKGQGPRYRWDGEAGMHISVEPSRKAANAKKAEAAKDRLRDIFEGHPSMRYTDLSLAIQKTCRVSERTAETRISEWKALGVIEPSIGGLYVPKL